MSQLTSAEASSLLKVSPADAQFYLVGAGGCGMCGLGHLLLDRGYRVAGSDLSRNGATEQLQARGAQIHYGHRAESVAAAHPVLVAYSSAIPRDNPEMREAERLQLPVVRRGVLLAALAHQQRALGVAGMHGKTTTSALLAFALDRLGAHPSYAIGASVPQLERPARWSAGLDRFFVVEADESDGTLHEFHPFGAIALNIDEEHLDYYVDLAAIRAEFCQFANQTRGPLIFCADDERLSEIFMRRPGASSYGYHPLATYRVERSAAADGSAASASHFTVWHRGNRLGEFRTVLIGDKNLSNVTAVIALLHQLEFGVENIASAIAAFRGATRRQEELFRDARFRILDDYGHHPAEIQATVQACRQLGARRILVAFQPHRYTRTRHLLEQFASSFREADRVWLTEIYAASEEAIPGVSGAGLAESVRAAGQAADYVPSVAELVPVIRAAMVPGDLVLFLGAGDITRAAHDLAAQLQSETVSAQEHLWSDISARLTPDTVLRPNEPLAKRTTMRVGGKADLFAEPASEADLAVLLQFCADQHLPITVIGRGSNLLIRDGGIRGLVVGMGHPNFSRLEVVGDRIHCGAGVKLKTLAVEARRAGLAGLEFLEGIPGAVGGALRMNAGAMGSWTFESVDRVRMMDYAGQVRELPAGEVHFEYRGCPLFKNHIALGAVFRGTQTEPAVIRQRMDSYSGKRWESQPNQPSAGCIFKNPQTIPAGKLIDELGLKGTRVGGALVSDVHGNFIVNDGSATARDVLNLIGIIQEKARAARGIELETEVEILGEE